MKKLSVVLPVYNGGGYLVAAVESILSQTMAEFELIAIDDGSSDDSKLILERFAATDSRLKVVIRENRGLIATLNQACGLAEGKYLVRMDADDICFPDRFEKQFEFMESNPNCVAAGGGVLLVDIDGDPIKSMGQCLGHDAIDRQHLMGRGGAIIHPAAIIRRESFDKIGGYRAKYLHAEDIDLFLRLAEEGLLANLEGYVLYYRQHLGSVGNKQRALQSASTISAVKDAYARRNLTFIEQDIVPAKSTPSKGDSYRKWGWWALNSKYLKTARKYALKAFWEEIYSKESWRLLFCAVRGY